MELMEILWRRSQATAEEVRSALPGDANESTVRTILRVLVRKGFAHCDARASPIVFRPALPRSKAQRSAISGLLKRFFGGSAHSLVLKLMEDELLTADDLKQLSDQFEEKKEAGR
jgi:predicted transcriptional regulator